MKVTPQIELTLCT